MKISAKPRGAAASARLLLPALGFGIAFLLCARTTPAADSTATAPPHQVSVRDAPGYYASTDPESLSEVTGRRTNAPAVKMPFTGGARSLDDLGRAVCAALHRSDGDSLYRLCITEDEFREILWREFPQSRPATGLTWLDGWKILFARLHAGRAHAMRDYGGHYWQFLRFESAPTGRPPVMAYRNFKLHQGLVLVVKDDEGAIQRWTWLRAVAERKGRFKLYSTDD